MAPTEILIENGNLVLPDRVIPKGVILVNGTKIAFCGSREEFEKVWKRARAERDDIRRLDAAGSWVCPALVEMHIHGSGGISFHDPVQGYLDSIGRFLAARGVGIFLPTMVPNPSYIEVAVRAIAEFGRPSRIPGIYVEGPFVSWEKKGGIPEEYIREISLDYFEELYRRAEGRLKVMTFAPELEGSLSLLERIRERGVIPALGHTCVSMKRLEEIRDTEDLLITHLFNTMSGVSHKDPGLAHWALLDGRVYTELNGDGTHVHPAAIDLALRLRPHERIVLISDAVVSAGLEETGAGQEGEYYHGERRAVRRGNGVYYESGTLIGSGLLIKDVVARMIRENGVPVYRAVEMASRNPLRLLDFNDKGALAADMDADISVFDQSFDACSLQIFEGQILHNDLSG
jgi:N-acetylglucosamine-6-phosphate deacetylase